MAYVQRFRPEGQDQVTLDYFMQKRLGQMMEPAQAQLVAQQVYDLARLGGVKKGNLTTGTLDAVFNQMLSGQITPLANPYEENISAVTGGVPQGRMPTGRGGPTGDLLPRTAMQSPIESMRPARYFSTADGATDFLGTSLYRFIDSSTIGLLGIAGRLLKKVGVTEENFWTETIGERQKLFGLDFGEGGIKGADTKAGEWGARAGEFAGFAVPIIASMGGALAVRGATSAAARATIGKMAAEKAGDAALASAFEKQAVKHAARAVKIQKTTAKVIDISNKLPANAIFEVGNKMVRRAIFGEAVKGVQSKVLAGAAGTAAGAIFGVTAASIAGKSVAQDVFEGAVKEAAEKAAGEAAYAGAHVGGVLSPKTLRAAKEAVEGGIYEAPEVVGAARQTFRTRFAADIQKKLGISYKGNEEFFNDIISNAGKAFDDAFKEARHSGGLMNLHEKAFQKGAGRLGIGAAKVVQSSATHVAGMVLMGAASRIAHPLAEPTIYGIDEEDGWQATKDVAKYWLKGAARDGKWNPFEGVTGDVLTGAMFATGGLANLVPGLQKTRSKNPGEMLGRMFGGTEGEWKAHLDILDMELDAIYKLVKKGQDPKSKGGIAGFIQSHLKRNHADFNDLFETNPAGFEHVAKKYYEFMLNNPDFVTTQSLPYAPADIMMAMKAHSSSPGFAAAADADKALYRSARDKIVDALFSHRKAWLESYNRSNAADLAKDLMRFGVVTTATSIMSAPMLWKAALDKDSDVHPADLVMHTMFSAMMARHPYYMDGASIYMPYAMKGRHITPEEMRELNGMRIRNALRHLGVRDSSLVLEGQKMRAPLVGSVENPLAFDQRVNAAWQDAQARAQQQGATGKEDFYVTNDVNSPVPQGMEGVTINEVQLFNEMLYARWRAGAEIDPGLMKPDKDGKPTVFRETFKDLAEMNELAQVVGMLKRKMVADGKLGKGEMFDPHKVVAAEGEYFTQKIGDLTRALGADPSGGVESGILGRMNELVEPVNGHIRHVRLGKLPEPGQPGALDPASLQRAQEIIDGYNELVTIAGMLRKPVHADENGVPLPELIDVTTDKLESMRALVEESGKVAAEILGIPKARLGRDGVLRNFIVTGLIGGKVHQNMVFGVHGGVLFTSEGDHISRDSVLRSMIEQGFGTTYVDDAGQTQYILWPVNYREIGDAPAGSGRPRKADIISNLYRFLRATKNVTIAQYKEGGKTVAPDSIERFFSRDGIIYDARANAPKITGRSGGLDAVLRDVGLLIDNRGVVEAFVEAVNNQRRSGVSREIRELGKLSEMADLLVRNPVTGRDTVAIPVIAPGKDLDLVARDSLKDTEGQKRERLNAIIRDLPKEYTDAAAALAQEGFELALTEDEYGFWRDGMQRLIDSGELGGWAAVDTYDTATGTYTTPPKGTFVVVGDKGNEGLKNLRKEIQRQMNRTVDERMQDIGEAIKILEQKRTELEGKASLTKNQKRQLMLTKGLLRKIKRSQTGGFDYLAVEKAMISSGLVKMRKGKRELNLKFGSFKELKQLAQDLKKFYYEDQLREREYDFRTIQHVADKNAREAIAAMRSGERGRARVSMAEFYVASGLAMNHSTEAEANAVLRDVAERMDAGSLQPEAAGAEIRARFDEILFRRLGAKGTPRAGLHDYKDVLGAVNDNYLLSLVQDIADTTEFREYVRERGTTMPPGITTMGEGPGAPMRENRDLARQETGGAVTRDWLSSGHEVTGASRDINISTYAKVAYLNPDGINLSTPERTAAFKVKMYTEGIQARMASGSSNDDTKSFVMLKDATESTRYTLIETPTDRAAATRLATQLENMLRRYPANFDVGNTELAETLRNVHFVIENLRRASTMTDDDVVGFTLRGELVGDLNTDDAMVARNTSLKTRMDLMTDVYSLVQLHEYFGAHAVMEAFQKAKTDPEAIPKLLTRVKLTATADDRRISMHEIVAAIHSTNKERVGANPAQSIHAGPTGMGLMDYLTTHAGVVDNHGRLQASFYVYDSKESGGRKGPQLPPMADLIDPTTGQPITQARYDELSRTMDNMDGGIILNTHLLKLLWHATGYDAFNPNTTYGVAKVRILQVGPDGALITKDVMSADAGIMELMEASNISGIMSTEAAKVFSGVWGQRLNDAIIDYGATHTYNGQTYGPRDMWGRVNHEYGRVRRDALTSHNASRLNIDLGAFVWQHPVDGNPAHATRSPQITGFRSEKFVQAIVEIVDSNAAKAVSVISELIGGTGMLNRMTQRAFFMSGRTAGLLSGGVNEKYVEHGGLLSTPTDFGGSKHYLNALKTSVMENYLFKIKTENGTQEVYTVDTHESLGSGEVVGSHKSGLKTTNVNTGMIAFEVEDFKTAQDLTAEIHGFGGRDNWYNAQPVGEEQRQGIPTNMVHVRILGDGKYDGIYLGLMRMASLATTTDIRNATPNYRALHADGRRDLVGTGARQTTGLMHFLGREAALAKQAGRNSRTVLPEEAAAIINQAWQVAIKGDGSDATINANVRAKLSKLAEMMRAKHGTQAHARIANMVEGVARELMSSREGMFADAGAGEQVINNGNVQRYRMLNALSYMFGTYDYYRTSRSVRKNRGNYVPFGLSIVSQRHPSTMLNDTFAMVQRGLLDVSDGTQVKGYWKDMEDIAKGDQDEDHFHSWYDYSPDEIGEAMRLRMITGGFGDPKVDEMPNIPFFRSPTPANEKRPTSAPVGLDYTEVLSARRRWGKAGIGLISKSIATGSALLHKNFAFEITINNERILVAPEVAVNANGQIVFTDPVTKMSIMDRTQSRLQNQFSGLAKLHNSYTDAKTSGVDRDPRDIDLQGFVLSKFYRMYRKDPTTGQYTLLNASVNGNDVVMSALKGAASTLYRVSSFGKDVFTIDGRRKMNIYEVDHMSQRYNTIWGKEANTARALKDIMQVSMSDGYIDFGRGRKARAISKAENRELAEAGKSIAIITPADLLKNRTVYDAMSEGVVKAMDSVYSADRGGYLTEQEAVSRGFGMEAIRQAVPEMNVARVGKWVANHSDTGPLARELSRRFSDGEELLAYEAYQASELYRQGIDYMRQTQTEADFDRGKRHDPRNPLERMLAVNNTLDNMAVNVARAIAQSFDMRSGEADQRLLAAYAVQKAYNRRMRQLYDQQYASKPEDFTDIDIIDAETRAEIYAFLDKWGGTDNVMVAALDLLTPVPDGWFVAGRQELPAYKNFKHAFFNVIQEYVYRGTVGDYGKLTPDLKSFEGRSLMELLAKARSTASSIFAGDSYALAASHDMIEVMATGGRSGIAAMQFKNLKTADRMKASRENIFAAMLNSEFKELMANMDGLNFSDPSRNQWGFSTATDASRFLRELQRDEQEARRIKIHGNLKRGRISQVRSDLLMENVDTAINAINISDRANVVTSRLERLVRQGEWQNLKAEEKIKQKAGKKELDYNSRVMLVKKREENLMHLMLRSLDANQQDRLTVLPQSAIGRGGGLAQKQAELMLKNCI